MKITKQLLAAYAANEVSREECAAVRQYLTDHPEELVKVLDMIDGDEDSSALDQEEILRRMDSLIADLEKGKNKKKMNYLPMTAMAAELERNRCVMQCELYILRKHGLQCSESEWEKQARYHGWLREEGTALFNIGRMLEMECFSTARTYHNTLEDVCQALDAGKDVIVVADCKELMDDSYRLQAEYIRDYTHGPTPNHAVVVTAVSEKDVIYFDPASGKEEMLPASLFEQAWNDSGNYMVCINERDLADYKPHPIDLSDVELPEGIEDLREAIAENAHEVWAEGRKAQGWTYGPERNDQLKQTPDMVPYSDLTESEKFFDREMAMNTIKLIRKIGYEIVKAPTQISTQAQKNETAPRTFRCNDCGNIIQRHEVFCSTCGKKLDHFDFEEE